MLTLRHTGISACLKSVFCLAFTLSPVALTAQSTACVLNPQQFAYVANQEDSTINGYTINPSDGWLTAIMVAGFPTPAPGLLAVAVDPTSRFVYAINSGSTKNVEGFTINCTNGNLTTMPGTLPSAGLVPTALTVDPLGRYVYVIGGTQVSAFKINQTSGQLTLIATYVAGSNATGITVDPQGKFVYVANQASGNISGYSINAATGALTQITGSPFAAGTDITALAIDPTDTFLYAANPGSQTISGYAINPTTGALNPLDLSPFSANGAAVSSITVDPTGNYVYAGGYGGVFAYSIAKDPFALTSTTYPPKHEYGSLTEIAGSPSEVGVPQSVAVDYTGTYLYAADRQLNQVEIYTLSSGVLKFVATAVDALKSANISLARPQTAPSYTASQVTLPTGFGIPASVIGVGVNDNGAVIGDAIFFPDAGYFAQGFISSGNTVTQIALGKVGTVNGVNTSGQVVGSTYTTADGPMQTPPQADLYNPNSKTTTNLDTVQGRQSTALSINNAGQITGSLTTGACVPPYNAPVGCAGNTHAFLDTGAGLVDIGTLGGTTSVGTSIDNLGIVVGISTTAGGATHIFSYAGNKMYDLGTAAGATFSNAIVNDLGQILASTTVVNGVGASYLWTNNVYTKLAFIGTGINKRTEIVGTKAAATATSRAIFYYGGTYIDLNELAPPGLPLLTSANAISNAGNILATGLNGQLYLLKPSN